MKPVFYDFNEKNWDFVGICTKFTEIWQKVTFDQFFRFIHFSTGSKINCDLFFLKCTENCLYNYCLKCYNIICKVMAFLLHKIFYLEGICHFFM